MESHRLRHFVAVVDHGGFTAAARAVYVSQPALSLAVKELEAELGVDLFVRSGRKVRLTAAGTALLEPARQVLRDLETGYPDRPGRAGGHRRPLRPADLGHLRARRHRCPRHPDRSASPFAGPAVTLSDSAARLRLRRGGGPPLGLLDRSAVRGGAARYLYLSAAPGRLVIAGAGAALVPGSVARTAASQGAVTARPEPPIERSLALVHRAGPLSPAADRFTEMAAAPSPDADRGGSQGSASPISA